MKRFFVFQYIKNGDGFSDAFDNLNEASDYGQMMWNHLTDSEKKRQYICVAEMEADPEYPDIPSEECGGFNPIREWSDGYKY